MQFQEAISLKSNHLKIPLKNGLLMNNPIKDLSFDYGVLPRRRNFRYAILRCRGVETPLPKQQLNFPTGSLDGERPRNVGAGKEIDVATLGNLCVDIVLDVPELPPTPLDQRKAFLAELSKSPPDKVWFSPFAYCNIFNFLNNDTQYLPQEC